MLPEAGAGAPPRGGAFHTVLLAAQRPGVVNTLAEEAGVSHKCLMPLGGQTLIEHTLSALSNAPDVGLISVVIDAPEVLKEIPLVARLKAGNRLRIVEAGPTLFDSLVLGLEDLDPPTTWPALVTTADNVLLTAEMIAHFCDKTRDSGADVTLGMVAKDLLLAAYPDGQRRFHKFRDGEWSNCNLYAVMSRNALEAAAVFRTGGQFVKNLNRVIKGFGLWNALAYKFVLRDRDDAFNKAGRKLGASIRVIDMPFPEAPIDVDNARSKRIAGEILAARHRESDRN